MARQYTCEYCFDQILEASPSRIIISDPVSGKEPYKKLIIQPVAGIWQIASYTDKQVFHENVLAGDLPGHLMELTVGHFRQVNAFADGAEHIVLISKKGICMYKIKRNDAITAAPQEPSAHNRHKKYIIEEGRVIPPLTDMGVFTADGHVVRSMYDKYRQINRFIEMIDDEIGDLSPSQEEVPSQAEAPTQSESPSQAEAPTLNIIDFGCGKSYLTFILYYYLTEIKNIKVNIVGLDLKADVIEKCNAAARKYGYNDLHFEVGDVNGYNAPFEIDMVVTLHACDTATDYALYNAVKWNAKYIFSVPCCQHELNSQIEASELGILTRYGIIKERFSALATDSIRADLLDVCGYKTQLLEFIDLEGTPKNLLIRAVRRERKNALNNLSGDPDASRGEHAERLSARQRKLLDEVEALCSQFSFRPTLLRLLEEEGLL